MRDRYRPWPIIKTALPHPHLNQTDWLVLHTRIHFQLKFVFLGKYDVVYHPYSALAH